MINILLRLCCCSLVPSSSDTPKMFDNDQRHSTARKHDNRGESDDEILSYRRKSILKYINFDEHSALFMLQRCIILTFNLTSRQLFDPSN